MKDLLKNILSFFLLVSSAGLSAAFWDSLERVNTEIGELNRALSTPPGRGKVLQRENGQILKTQIQLMDCQLEISTTVTIHPTKPDLKTTFPLFTLGLNLITTDPVPHLQPDPENLGLSYEGEGPVFFGDPKERKMFLEGLGKLRKACLKKLDLVRGKLSPNLPHAFGPGTSREKSKRWDHGLSDLGETLHLPGGPDLIYLLNQFHQVNLLKNPEADEDCLDSILQRTFEHLGKASVLIESMEIRGLVELLKNSNLRVGIDHNRFKTLVDFWFHNEDQIRINLTKHQRRQNLALAGLFRKKPPLQEKDFLDFLKVENDINWMIEGRNNIYKYKLDSLRTSDKESFDKYRYQYEKTPYFDQMMDLSLFRIRLVLEKFKKDNPQLWESLILGATEEAGPEKDLEYDFNHYGRYGVAGNILLDMIKYDQKILKSGDGHLKANHYAALSMVLQYFVDKNNPLNLADLAEVLRKVNLATPGGNAFKEAILLYSEYEQGGNVH